MVIRRLRRGLYRKDIARSHDVTLAAARVPLLSISRIGSELPSAGVYSGRHGGRIDEAIFNLVQDHARTFSEHLLNSFTGERARFKKQNVVLLGASARLEEGHGAF